MGKRVYTKGAHMATKYDKRKELKRIRQFFRRAEKRGFSYKPDFDPASLNNLPAYKLHELSADKLYNKLQFAEEGKKPVSGNKARKIVEQINRKAGAIKAAITRKFKKQEKEKENVLQKRTERTKETKQQRAELREKVDTQTPIEKLRSEGFTMEEIELNNIMERINQFPSPGADLLEKTLNREIEAYGREAVAKSISQIPDYIKAEVERVLHYEAKSEGHDSIIKFIYLIEGGIIPEMSELKTVGEVTDSYALEDIE